MKDFKWLNLQLFAGEGDGGGEGAATGAEGAADAGQQRLLELGVPAEKLRRRAKRAEPTLPEGAVRTQPVQQTQPQEQQAAAAEETHPEKEPDKSSTPARMTWEQIKADPEYNQELQRMMQGRLKGAKAAQDAMGKLAPALEVLARKHGMDPANIDYEALAQKIHDDDEFYENKALEMGVPLNTAKKIDQEERATARAQREQARTLEQQRIMQHFSGLEQQAQAMKATFPDFDLRRELQNPAFARMTAPNVGISVEDAYYAVHRKEIQQASMQVAAQKTAQQISNAIQSGSRRPDENGTSGQAPSATTFNYRNATPQQRAELKKRIRDAAARGEKLYPGSYKGR